MDFFTRVFSGHQQNHSSFERIFWGKKNPPTKTYVKQESNIQQTFGKRPSKNHEVSKSNQNSIEKPWKLLHNRF